MEKKLPPRVSVVKDMVDINDYENEYDIEP